MTTEVIVRKMVKDGSC